MKRLVEIKADSPSIKLAQRLIASVEPLPESSERMWRIRRELNQVRGATPFYRRLSAAGLAGLLLLFGASVFAAVRVIAAVVESRKAEPQLAAAETRRSPERSAPAPADPPSDALARELTAPPPERPPVSAAPLRSLSSRAEASSPVPRVRHPRRAAQRKRTQRATPQQVALPKPAGYAAPETSQAAPEQAARAAAQQQRTTSAGQPSEAAGAVSGRPAAGVTDSDLERKESKPRDASKQSKESQPSGEASGASDEAGSELVHRALRALRRDGDAALATRLLERHRTRDPDGPLAEEALALQIEAAAHLGQPRARGFAREYLTRYPGGRYRNVAERVLANPRP